MTAFVRLDTVKSICKSAWLLAALSGLLQVLIFPRPNLVWLCWVALAPLLVALLRARRADAAELLQADAPSPLAPARVWQGFWLGWLSGTIFYLGSCYWVYPVMHLFGGLPRAVSLLLLVLFSLYIGLHHALFGMLMAVAARRGSSLRRALLLAPFLWVSVELLRAYLVSFPWDLLGNAQIDNLPLARLASFTGVYGISFEIAVVNTVFAAAALMPRRQRRPLLTAALTAAIALQSTALVRFEPATAEGHATLVQQNVPIVREWSSEDYRKLASDLAAISHAPQAGRDPSLAPLIIWPESPAPFVADARVFVSTTRDLARQQHSWLLAGTTAMDAPPRPGEDQLVFNSAVLVNPSGMAVQRYDKVHLVPWGEYVPFSWAFGFAKALTHEVGVFTSGGRERQPLDIGAHRYGVFICYESVFPHEVRQFAAHGAEVFINLSNDGWYGESGAAWQHLNMLRMRAVENHRWVLRSTNTGITASIDPLGRVVASLPRNQRLALDAPYGLEGDQTFYTRYGDWFPLLCAIIAITGLLWRERAGEHLTQPVPV